jgi:hypothetical protein
VSTLALRASIASIAVLLLAAAASAVPNCSKGKADGWGCSVAGDAYCVGLSCMGDSCVGSSPSLNCSCNNPDPGCFCACHAYYSSTGPHCGQVCEGSDAICDTIQDFQDMGVASCIAIEVPALPGWWWPFTIALLSATAAAFFWFRARPAP